MDFWLISGFTGCFGNYLHKLTFMAVLKVGPLSFRSLGWLTKKKSFRKKNKSQMACFTTVKILSRIPPQFHLLKERLKVLIPSRNIKIIRITFEKTMLQ